MTEAELIAKISSIYFTIAKTIGTVSEEPELSLARRCAKVVVVDLTKTVPIADIKFVEWYLYEGGTGKEAVFLIKKDPTEPVDDVLAKALL